MAEGRDAEQRVLLELEYLQECYNVVLLRRVERGRQSIRTRSGYELLRSKYQPRLRFLHEAGTENIDSAASDAAPDDSGCKQPTGKASQEAHDLHGDEVRESSQDVALSNSDENKDEDEDESGDNERAVLEKMVGVYFDPRIKRFITDVCWPLAHFGGQINDQSATVSLQKHIPEWQELEQEKYFAFTFKMLLWLFPGLPGFEAQDQAERDWQKDCEFDGYGSYGLSYEGFAISLIDLATACTSGSVEACLEFLEIMTRRLQLTLPTLRDPPQKNLLSGEDSDEGDLHPGQQLQEKIVWRQIPLERLTPCQLRPKAQYYELKFIRAVPPLRCYQAKLSMHPLVLMVLLGNEKPAELQLSTSAKLLIRERDNRTSIRRKTIALKSHFVELEKQFLWTFRDLGDRPSLLLIPNHYISRRTLSLYACLRLIDGREQELQVQSGAIGTEGEDAALDSLSTFQSASSPPPILTLFSNIQESFPLLYGTEKSLCGRIDRQSTRLFIVDHRERSNPFVITLKTSLIQNTASAGGAGAAAVVAALTPPSSSTSTSINSNSSSDSIAAHSFIFVVKFQDELVSKPHVRVQKMQATLPQQWYTTLSGPSESKSILINAPDWSAEASSTIPESDAESQDSSSPHSSAAGLYYLYIFSLHGFYFEAFYEDQDGMSAETTTNSSQDLSSGDPKSRVEAGGDNATTNAASGSGERNEDDDLLGADDPLGARRIVNSASLLQRLLLMRKRRQKAIAVQLPPDLLEGSKVTNVKPLSTAETLKSKFLRARAMERQVRLLKNTKEVQTKVLAKILRSKKKRELFMDVHTEESSTGSSQTANAGCIATEHLHQSDEVAKTNAKVVLLSEFFKDMAVYQPSQEELQDKHAEQAVAEKAEDALLDDFADFFEGDAALQNLVDEEKWLPSDERTIKRTALMQERTLRSRGKASSLRLVHSRAAPSEFTVDTTPLTSADYVSTAQYIEELMREISREEAKALTAGNCSTALTPEEVEAEQLTVSWTYAQKRTQPRDVSARTPIKLKESEKRDLQHFVDQNRRAEWMKSQYIQHLAASEHVTRHQASPLRSPFIPKMQTFHDQEESMPWQAVWEAPAVGNALTAPQELAPVSASVLEACHSLQTPRRQAPPRSPHRPPGRPKTAVSPRIGTGTECALSRCEVSTASQSAAFSYRHTRRIRSAQARAMRAPATSSVSLDEASTAPLNGVALFDTMHRPVAANNANENPVYRQPSLTVSCSDSNSIRKTAYEQQEEPTKLEWEPNSSSATRSSTNDSKSPLEGGGGHPATAASPLEEHRKVEATRLASPVQVTKSRTKKKRSATKQSDAEKRFSRQVHELLAISMELKRKVESERALACETAII